MLLFLPLFLKAQQTGINGSWNIPRIYDGTYIKYDSLYLVIDTNYTATDTATATHSDIVYQGGKMWVWDDMWIEDTRLSAITKTLYRKEIVIIQSTNERFENSFEIQRKDINP